jgi:hypothetical protein
MAEVVVSMGILVLAVVGLGATSGRLARLAAEAENRARALEAVEDRLSMIRLHPDYQELESLFSESNVGVPGLPAYLRSTKLTRVVQPGEEGREVDFTHITVTVLGPGLIEPISRTVTLSPS